LSIPTEICHATLCEFAKEPPCHQRTLQLTRDREAPTTTHLLIFTHSEARTKAENELPVAPQQAEAGSGLRIRLSDCSPETTIKEGIPKPIRTSRHGSG
jgi:hypothetical protein